MAGRRGGISRTVASVALASALALLASLGGDWGDALGQTAGPPPTRVPAGVTPAPGPAITPLPASEYRPPVQAPAAPPAPPAPAGPSTAVPAATSVPTAPPATPAIPTASPTSVPTSPPAISPIVTQVASPTSIATMPPAAGGETAGVQSDSFTIPLALGAGLLGLVAAILWRRRR